MKAYCIYGRHFSSILQERKKPLVYTYNVYTVPAFITRWEMKMSLSINCGMLLWLSCCCIALLRTICRSLPAVVDTTATPANTDKSYCCTRIWLCLLVLLLLHCTLMNCLQISCCCRWNNLVILDKKLTGKCIQFVFI